MPSGAKKRKAAKKKKELEANNTNTNPYDHDDAKSQDEKRSDGGEVNSPAHQDHHNNHHPSNEGDTSGVRPIVSGDSKTMEKVFRGVEEQKVGSQEAGIVKIQWSLKPENDGDDGSSSSSSSSSSSDDESRSAEKKREKEPPQVTEDESSGDVNLVAELSSVIESVKSVVPASEETISVIETAPVENLLVSEVIKSDSGAQKLSTAVPETVTSFSPKKYEDKVLPLSDDNSKASPSELELDSKGCEGKELPPSNVYVAQPITDTDHTKDSEIPEHSGNQPAVASAEPPVQKTFWLSCCGIFDLFSGSSR